MKKREKRVPVLILGGGLAGLSAAYHLKKNSSLVIEREKEVGGTARSFSIKGFTFDFTGHLLHLHHPYTKNLIKRLLRNKLFSCVRNTAIFSNDAYTLYPYQANNFGLPENTVDQNMLSFLDVYFSKHPKAEKYRHMNFKDWCLNIFGKGISENFMIPYNQKLYQVPCQSMTVDWCGSFVPQVRLEDVIRGALTPQDKMFGYNATFYYPKRGGIQSLARSFAKSQPGIKLQTSIKKIVWKDKIAVLSSGVRVHYDNLINTIPLYELLKVLWPKPPEIKKAMSQLKAVSILCLNLGVKRKKISDRSWIYFPEKKFPFYRVGFPMNFTPHIVPRGCSSMYVELPMNWAKTRSKKEILKQVKRGLIEARILKPSDRFAVAQFLPIRYAYVIYDRNRSPALKVISSFLKEHSVQSIGRYGAWKYSFMEEAILDGKAAAETLPYKR